MEWVQKGFGLMTGFTGLSDTACCYSLHYTVLHTHIHTFVVVVETPYYLQSGGIMLISKTN
jgi:hypothetical protein